MTAATDTETGLEVARNAGLRLIVRLCFALVPFAALAAAVAGNPVWPPLLAAALFAGFGALGANAGGRTARIAAALGLVGQAIAITAALAGHAWQLDSHMIFFALLAATLVMSDEVAVLAAAAAIAAHHLMLTLALPALIYPSLGLANDLSRTLFHGLVVTIEAGALWWAIRSRNRLEAERADADARARAEAARRAAEQSRLEEERTAVVAALQRALHALADGDLGARIDDVFAGRYEDLRHDFNGACTELSQAIASVHASAEAVRSETQSIAGASTTLSQRSEKQAATLAEIVGAADRIAARIREQAAAAANAESRAASAHKRAEESKSVVQSAEQTMRDIQEASREIGQITGVINEIAFQTNLLALNANVEASRAGDAGRGFSIVADEVRALAQRSADAAERIGTLISESDARIDKGVQIAGTAAEALTRIGEEVATLSEHVSAISHSATEQSSAVDEINGAMHELDQMSQRNVAMFEETSAASLVLQERAESLSEVVARFRGADGPATEAGPARSALAPTAAYEDRTHRIAG